MLKYTKIAVLVLMPCLANAQSVSVAPYSFEAWGELSATTAVSFEYKMVGLHAFFIHEEQYSGYNRAPTPEYAFALSAMTPRIQDVLRGGVIYFTQPFPTPTDTKLNAFLEISYKVKSFRIFFRHISNAGTGKTNHGMDYVGVSIHL